MRYKLESTLTVGGGAVLKNLDCEWQKFLLAHRRWGTFRETSLSGDELGETSAVRRLEKLRGNETVRVSFVEEILPKIQVRGIFRIRGIRRNVLPKFIEICIETPCWCPSVNLVRVGRREPWERGCPSGWINSYVVWIFVTSYENQQLFWLYSILFSMNSSCDFELQRALCCFSSYPYFFLCSECISLIYVHDFSKLP